MKTFDVVIVGAGIVGCACARELARNGQKVAVIEGKVVGSGATAAGMGHLVVMDDSPAQLTLTNYSRGLWHELIDELPSSVEYESCGTIWVAADDEEMAEVHSKQKTYGAAGINSEVLSASELAHAEPNLRSGLAGGLLVQEDGVVYPPTAADYFLEEAQACGAELLEGSAAVFASRGKVRLANGTGLTAKHIVLASGADCSILPELPMRKRKGHLLITDRYPGYVRHQLVELGYLKSAHSSQSDSVAFNVQPRRTGQLLIGSSRQFDSDSPAAEPAIAKRMMEQALRYMPGLAHLSGLRIWTGFRAATPDKLPLIGPAGRLGCDVVDDSLWLAAGFEGLGITNAPGAARLLADQMLERTSAIDVAPYLPERFASREAAYA